MIEVFDDFLVPLMHILDRLPSRAGVAGDVLRLFEETYRDQLPSHQYTDNESGRIRWEHNVRWSREKLKKLGYIDAPRTGIWRLTEEGHEWLIEHQNAVRISGGRSRAKAVNRTTSLTAPKTATRQFGQEKDFLGYLQENLSLLLRPVLGSISYECNRRSNYLQIRLSGFSGCHYEIKERRGKCEIALHFESSAERSQARLRSFEPHLEELNRALGMKVQAGDYQSRGWTQVFIEQPRNPLIPLSFHEDADLVLRFVSATYPILQTIYITNRVKTYQRSGNGAGNADGSFLYRIVDQEVATIRSYIQGRSLLQPNDEKLCDWVNFCYTFSLYAEGKDLFSLINEADVNPWYYERTKKIAKACEQKTKLSVTGAGQ